MWDSIIDGVHPAIHPVSDFGRVIVMVDLIPDLAIFRPLRCLREAAEREQSEQKDGSGRFFHTNFGLYWEKKT